MNKFIVILGSIFSFFLSFAVSAQYDSGGNSGIPYKTNRSPLFGKDIIIHDKPDRDQRNVAVCSAFNGWLYAAYYYTRVPAGNPAIVMLKSVDKGISWTVLWDCYLDITNSKFSSIKLLTTGNSIANFKLFMATVCTIDYYMMGEGMVIRYNGETGEVEDEIIHKMDIYDITIASDLQYPSSSSNTLGILYSQYSSAGDSIIFCSLSNGGLSIDSRHAFSSNGNHPHKVSLAFGRSQSWNGGRYFAAWEEKDDYGSVPGRIYTAHTEPNFNSPFSAPVNLDGIDPANANLCRNPVIACQYNNADNDSSNLTEIVLFDKFDESTQRDEVKGYYNLQATSHTHYKSLNIPDILHHGLQPDICFNPFDSTFMITYFDSTEKKLPFIVNNYNLRNPSQWNVISSGFNDSTNLTSPYPKVNLDFEQHKGINVWSSDQITGDGIAMFDAQYSTYTNIYETNNTDNTRLLGVYPNPCNNSISITFEIIKTEKVTINILNIYGEIIGTVTDQTYPVGRQKVNYDVTNFPPGCYLYTFKSSDNFISGKFSVIK